jgi:hypothetical protein
MVQKRETSDKVESELAKTSPVIEIKYKKIVTVMSWVLGISFFLVILLPNFIPPELDIAVKVLFFIGFITLLGFAFLEMFGKKIKIYFSQQR